MKIYHLRRVRNQQYPVIFRQIVGALQENQFEVEDVQIAFNLLKADVEALSFIKAKNKLSIHTETIQKLTKERHEYLTSMRDIVKGMRKSPSAKMREAADTLYVWLNREREHIARMTLAKQSQTVVRLADDLRSDTTLQEALETVGQTETMDALIQVSQQVQQYEVRRIEEQSEKKVRTLELRMNAYTALQVFISAVQQSIALKKGDRAKHQEYLKVIEEIMVYTSGQVSSNDTRRKNAEKDATTDAPIDTIPTKETQTSNTHKTDNGKLVMMPDEKKSTHYSLNRMTVLKSKPQQDKVHKDIAQQDAKHEKTRHAAMAHHVPNETAEIPIEGDVKKQKVGSSDFDIDRVRQNGQIRMMVDS